MSAFIGWLFPPRLPQFTLEELCGMIARQKDLELITLWLTWAAYNRV